MHDRKLTACDDDSGLTTPTEPLEETALPGQSSPRYETARRDLVARLSLAAATRGSPSISPGARSADDPPLQSGLPGAVAMPEEGESCSTHLPAVAAQAFPFAIWTTGSVHPPERRRRSPVPVDHEGIDPEAPAAELHAPDPAENAFTEPPTGRTGPAEDLQVEREAQPDSEGPQAEQTPPEQAAGQQPVPPENLENQQEHAAPCTGAELPVQGERSGYAASAAVQSPDAGQPPRLEVPEARPAPQPKRRRVRRLLATAARFAALALAVWFAAMVFLIVLFRFVDPPTSALILLRSAQGVNIDQRWTPLEKISPNLVHAVITSEDGRFCSHWGIDPQEVAEAISRSAGGRPRGASTMTMQLAKNLFLWPHQSYLRKALEVPLTVTIDAVWPKRRIAEVYLNIVEWGRGIFGAEAASRRHFNRSAEKLTTQQAALLAVTLPNPRHRKPGAPSRLMNKMASTIMARMRASPAVDDCVISPR